MEYSYKISFAHQDDTKEDMHGFGTVDITTDLPITTDEQRLEVARTIGLTHDFTQVAILSIEEVQNP